MEEVNTTIKNTRDTNDNRVIHVTEGHDTGDEAVNNKNPRKDGPGTNENNDEGIPGHGCGKPGSGGVPNRHDDPDEGDQDQQPEQKHFHLHFHLGGHGGM